MARGKQTCKILKEIRRQIAEANDIEFVTSECRYKGDCLGTCPKCEAEVRYLEQQLRSRQLMGKAVVLAGLSAGMIAFSGCGSSSNQKSDDSYRLQGDPMELAEGDDERGYEGELPVQEVSDSIRDAAMAEAEEADTLELVFTEGIIPRDSDSNRDAAMTEDEVADTLKIIVEEGLVGFDFPENPDQNKIYERAEQRPEFPGGDEAMTNFIEKNLKYPEELLEAGFQGRVILKFCVDTLGNVCEPTIIRGRGAALDREAIRLVKSFPQFSPGRINGKKVKVWYTLPIVFKLPAG